jgi:hypothetical protein
VSDSPRPVDPESPGSADTAGTEAASLAVYERVVEQVNDGVEVDWARLEAAHPRLVARWKSLRRVQEVGAAFRDASDPGGDAAATLPGAAPAAPGRPDPFPGSAPPRTAASAADPGAQRWGTLELREKIGEGSFGEVYRAHDPVLARDVALKLTRHESPSQRQRFLREGRLLAQLDHPAVVRVHGAAVHEGRAGVWMDLATGRTLAERLEQDGRFTEREAVDVGRQLAAALCAVHAAGLVHGDLKAANVLRRDGGDLVLGDFGSSLDLRAEVEGPGSATPLTAAPEVLRGDTADARSDLYSLGVLLYQLLTGTYPFLGGSAAEIERAQREDTPSSVRSIRPEVSAGLSDVIQRAICVDADQRWPSAEALADALEASSGASSEVSRAKVSRSGRVAGSLVLVVLAAAFVWQFWGLADPPMKAPGKVPAAVEPDAEPPGSFSRFDAAPSLGGEPVRVNLLRSGRREALRSGDTVGVGDALHLEVSGNSSPLWLYLVNEDAEGQVFALFPLPGVEPQNPLPLGDVRLPGQLGGVDQDWVVTSEGGSESFLLITSRQPLPELERRLTEITTASADRRPSHPGTFAADATRGVGGLEVSVESAAAPALRALAAVAVGESEESEGAARVEIVTLRGMTGND